MKNAARNSRRGDVILVCLLLLGSLGMLSRNSRADVTPLFLDRPFIFLATTLLNSSTNVSDSISEVWGNYVALVDLAEKNQALVQEIEKLRAEKTRLGLVERELASVKKLLKFQEQNPTYLAARVIGRDLNPSSHVIRVRVNRGEHDQIRKGMAVVTEAGIVGQVSKVSRNYADVLLLVDPQSRIDVMVERTRSVGTLLGKGDKDDYLCSIPYLSRDEIVREGDVIVTSGLDQLFPKGLLVGTVTQGLLRKERPFQEVEVRPSVDFSTLEYVFVLDTTVINAAAATNTQSSQEPKKKEQ